MSKTIFKVAMISLAAICFMAIAPEADAAYSRGYGGVHRGFHGAAVNRAAVRGFGGGYYHRGTGAYGRGYIGNRWGNYGYGHNWYGRHFNRDYLFGHSRYFNNNRFFLGSPYNYYAPYAYYQYAMPYADVAAVVIVDNDDLSNILAIGNDSYLGDDYNNVIVVRVSGDVYGRFHNALRLRDFRDFRYDRLRNNLSFRTAQGLYSAPYTMLGY